MAAGMTAYVPGTMKNKTEGESAKNNQLPIILNTFTFRFVFHCT